MKQRPGTFLVSNEQIDYRHGYWFVQGNFRTFISEKVDPRALELVCAKYLNDETGYDYWIDYCVGHDIMGTVAWVNVDQTDKFI